MKNYWLDLAKQKAITTRFRGKFQEATKVKGRLYGKQKVTKHYVKLVSNYGTSITMKD